MRNKLHDAIEKQIDERLGTKIEEIKQLKKDVQLIRTHLTQEKDRITNLISEIITCKINVPLEGILYTSKNWGEMMNQGMHELSHHQDDHQKAGGIPFLYFTETLESDQLYFCKNGFVFGALKVVSGKGSFDFVGGHKKLTHLNFIKGDKYMIFLLSIVLFPDELFGIESSDTQSKDKLKYCLVGLLPPWKDPGIKKWSRS
jgi:hypothetical protein